MYNVHTNWVQIFFVLGDNLISRGRKMGRQTLKNKHEYLKTTVTVGLATVRDF